MLVGLVVCLFLGTSVVLAQSQSSYTGGSSAPERVWSDTANWEPDSEFPNNGNGGMTFDVVIERGGPQLDLE